MRGLGEAPLPLFAAADAQGAVFSPEGLEPDVPLRPLSEGREVVEHYRALQLSLHAHPLAFLRQEFTRRGITRCADLAHFRDGRRVEVAWITIEVRLALRCLIAHCPERWPLDMFWNSAGTDHDIGRAQGCTAALNGIARQLGWRDRSA